MNGEWGVLNVNIKVFERVLLLVLSCRGVSAGSWGGGVNKSATIREATANPSSHPSYVLRTRRYAQDLQFLSSPCPDRVPSLDSGPAC